MGSLLKTVCVGAAASLLVGWVAIATHYSRQENELRKAQQQSLQTLQSKFQNQQDTQRRDYLRELETAMGGPVAAIGKDPSLDIQTMLRKAAQACAPKGAKIEVHVDRFTEFDVDFVLKTDLSKQQMASIAKSYLGVCSEHVNSLRFIYERAVVAEIEKRAIDQVPDWQSVSLQAVAALF